MTKKIAVISGGLGDLGSAIATRLGREDICIAIGDLLTEEQAAPKLNELKAAGCKEIFYQKVDVCSEDEVTNWLQNIEKKWGIPRIIIANAGTVVRGLLTDPGFTADGAKKQLDVNFWGSYHLAVNAAKNLKASRLPGRIVFIGSWAGEKAIPRISAYCISKAAMRMLCKTLALELAEDDILVNEIAIGIVDGGLSKKNRLTNPDLLQTQLSYVPIHQLVSVSEVARHVASLCEFSDFTMTGSTLLVDGGISLTSNMSS